MRHKRAAKPVQSRVKLACRLLLPQISNGRFPIPELVPILPLFPLLLPINLTDRRTDGRANVTLEPVFGNRHPSIVRVRLSRLSLAAVPSCLTTSRAEFDAPSHAAPHGETQALQEGKDVVELIVYP